MDRNITMLENKLERIYDLCGGKEAELESGKRIKKVISAYGKRIQYSVFEFELPNNIRNYLRKLPT